MKNFIYFILVMCIGYTSCDGRKSKKQTLSENIKSFKKKNTIITNSYNSKKHIKREVDSILSNGFNIKIKTETNSKDGIYLSKTNNGITYSEYYNTYNFTIDVKYRNSKIYRKTFNRENMISYIKHFLKKSSERLPDDFSKYAILQSIQLNEELSIKKDSIYIDIAYAKPNDTHLAWHTLKINRDGTSKFIQFVN